MKTINEEEYEEYININDLYKLFDLVINSIDNGTTNVFIRTKIEWLKSIFEYIQFIIENSTFSEKIEKTLDNQESIIKKLNDIGIKVHTGKISKDSINISGIVSQNQKKIIID